MPAIPSLFLNHRRSYLIAALAAIALLCVACGGGGSPAPTPTPDPPQGGFRGAGRFAGLSNLNMEAFTACMQAAGFNVAQNSGLRGIFGGANSNPAEAQAAQNCASAQGVTLPQGRPGGGFAQGSSGAGPRFNRAALANCLRNAGINVPTGSSANGSQGGLGSLNRNDPKVQAALQSCFGTGGQ